MYVYIHFLSIQSNIPTQPISIQSKYTLIYKRRFNIIHNMLCILYYNVATFKPPPIKYIIFKIENRKKERSILTTYTIRHIKNKQFQRNIKIKIKIIYNFIPTIASDYFF